MVACRLRLSLALSTTLKIPVQVKLTGTVELPLESPEVGPKITFVVEESAYCICQVRLEGPSGTTVKSVASPAKSIAAPGVHVAPVIGCEMRGSGATISAGERARP